MKEVAFYVIVLCFVSSKSFCVVEQLAGSFFFFISIGMPFVSTHSIQLTISHLQPFSFVMLSLQ